MSTTTVTEDQANLAAEIGGGLRQVADFVEANPEYAEWFEYTLTRARINLHLPRYADQPTALARFAKAALRSGATVDKEVSGPFFCVVASFGVVKAHTLADRDEVCEAKVVGTRKVTKPDPEAMAKVPTVEVEEDVIEWECRPLLANAGSNDEQVSA